MRRMAPAAVTKQAQLDQVRPLVAQELAAVGEGVLRQAGAREGDPRQPDERRRMEKHRRQQRHAGQPAPEQQPAPVACEGVC